MTLKERAPLVATTAPRPEGVRAGAPPLAVLTPRRASTQDRHTRGSHRCRYATGGTQRKGTAFGPFSRYIAAPSINQLG